MSLLFNMLSRLAIALLPRSKCLLILWLQSLSTVLLEPKKVLQTVLKNSTITRQGTKILFDHQGKNPYRITITEANKGDNFKEEIVNTEKM